MTHHRKWINRFALLALTCGMTALAAPPKSGPVMVMPPARGQFQQPNAGELSNDEIWNMLASAMCAPTPREDVLDFFRKHSPRRFEMYERVPESMPRLRTKLLDGMIARFKQIDRRRTEDPDLYNLMVKQLELQDESFALVHDQKNPKEDDQLRQKVGEMVDLSMQERQKRIDRLEATIKELKAKFEDDKSNRSGLIDQQIDQLAKDAKNYADRLDRLRNRPHAPPTPSK